MIYLDHSATTAVDPRVVEAMLPFWTETYGNPSSIYGLGRRAGAALEDARRRIAAILNCQPAELVFTSCGTESDNLAMRGVLLAAAAKGKRHIITAPTEHHAVLHTAADLAEHLDFDVTHVPVDRQGIVDPAAVAAAIRPDTALISIMLANNEVGTIQPIAEIGAIARERGVPFHTDAVQAGGYLPLDVDALNVDLLALSAHKFYGPKGVGLLYVRRGVRLLPVQTGGGQERGRRSGTENVPYIVGMARALEIAHAERESETRRLTALRDRLIDGLTAAIPDITLTGHPTQRLPGHASFLVRGVEAEAHADRARSGGRGGLVRLRVRHRRADPQPCAHRDGLRPAGGDGRAAAHAGPREHRGRCGFRGREAAGDCGTDAGKRVDK